MYIQIVLSIIKKMRKYTTGFNLKNHCQVGIKSALNVHKIT